MTCPRLPLLFLLSAAAFAQSAVNVDSLTNTTRLSDVAIAPDGKAIVLVASRPNYEDNRFDTQLLRIDPQSGAQRILSDRRSIKRPRWSPSGDRLAFLANDAAGKAQIFVLPIDGGEARAVTKADDGVTAFEWRPNGADLAYLTADTAPRKSGPERHNQSFEVGRDSILTQTPPRPKHLWLVPASGAKPARLTSGEWSVSGTDFSFSPDGKLIAYVKAVSPHTGDQRESSIQILDCETRQSRPLTGRSQREAAPLFSPDGKSIAYEHPARGPYHSTEILLSPVGGGEGRSLTRAIDRNLKLIRWTPSGDAILVTGNDASRSGAWLQPTSGAARPLPLNSGVFSREAAIDIGPNGESAFAVATPNNPGELYWSTPNQAPRRLTHFNSATEKLPLGKTERLVWKSDQLQLDGVVTYPPNFDRTRKYPLVLDIHGGPTSASKEGFSPRAQLFAAQGWVVFEPNYRGSDNLGDTIQSAIVDDAGAGPGRDIMRGIDELKRRGFIDESRIATGGWSYGGYLTVWLLGNYPKTWKAAIAGAAAVDRLDSYNFSDMNVGFGPMLGGSPWSDSRIAKYRAQSAIEHVQKIEAPVMILHNTRDERVLITNGYKLYHALRDRGVPVRFIAYPVAGHSAPDPVHQKDVLVRWVDWFRQHLSSTAAPTAP